MKTDLMRVSNEYLMFNTNRSIILHQYFTSSNEEWFRKSQNIFYFIFKETERLLQYRAQHFKGSELTYYNKRMKKIMKIVIKKFDIVLTEMIMIQHVLQSFDCDPVFKAKIQQEMNHRRRYIVLQESF